MYKISTDYIIREADQVMIPKDEKNTDYIEYLRWVALGNTATEDDIAHSYLNTTPAFQSVIVTINSEE